MLERYLVISFSLFESVSPSLSSMLNTTEVECIAQLLQVGAYAWL